MTTDKAHSPTVVDRKSGQQRQTFLVQIMQTDGKQLKQPLFVVPQKGEEQDMMKVAFDMGIKSFRDQKVDEMVASVILKKSVGKVEAEQALLPKKKGKMKRFFGALNPFKGSKKEKPKPQVNVPYMSPKHGSSAKSAGSANEVVMFTEQEVEACEQERANIIEQIKELQLLGTNDDPAVIEKINNLLTMTSQPEHLQYERRISRSLITTESNLLIAQLVAKDIGGTVCDSSDDSDEFMDALEDTMIMEQDEEEEEKDDDGAAAAQEAERVANAIIEKAKDFRPYTDLTDDFRVAGVHKDGGFPLDDPEVVARYRRAAKSIIKQIGRSIFSGSFNLGSVSFPIDCMSHKSMVYLLATQAIHAPLYLTAAHFATDPIERMKYVIVTSLSFIHPVHMWDKPLNPILGETLQGTYQDGSLVYMEQVTHHPPISYFYFEGPKKMYRFYAYTSFAAGMRMNSVNVKQEGKKVVEFDDGTVIKFTPLQDVFHNTLFGTMNHMCTGTVTFTDEKNGLTAWYTIGEAGRKYAKDYCKGEIKRGDQVVSKLFGSYMGYIEFDGKRYWDERRQTNYAIKGAPKDHILQSDWSYRPDTIKHQAGEMAEAQVNKDFLENNQRADRKLREAATKRRQSGGPKYDYSAYPNHPLHNV